MEFIKARIFDHIWGGQPPAVDAVEMKAVIEFMGFENIANLSPPAATGGTGGQMYENIMAVDIEAWFDEIISCQASNEAIAIWIVELVKNPTKYGVPEDWGKDSYLGIVDPNVNDLGLVLKRGIHFSLLMDYINKEVIDLGRGDTSTLVDIIPALENRMQVVAKTENWKSEFFRLAKTDAIFPIVKYESILGPVLETIKITDMSAVRDGLFHCCNEKAQRRNVQMNIYEAVIFEYILNFPQNSRAGGRLNRFFAFLPDGEIDKAWGDIYGAWNLAFQTGVMDMVPMLFGKLLIPTVGCMPRDEPKAYLGYRAVSLYLALHYYKLHRIKILQEEYPMTLAELRTSGNPIRNKMGGDRQAALSQLVGNTNDDYSRRWYRQAILDAAGENAGLQQLQVTWHLLGEQYEKVILAQLLEKGDAYNMNLIIAGEDYNFENAMTLTMTSAGDFFEGCYDIIPGPASFSICFGAERSNNGRRRASSNNDGTVALSVWTDSNLMSQSEGTSSRKLNMKFKVAAEQITPEKFKTSSQQNAGATNNENGGSSAAIQWAILPALLTVCYHLVGY